MNSILICASSHTNATPVYLGNEVISICRDNIKDSPTKLNDRDVLVKIKAFSCNYRDRSIIVDFHRQCRKMSDLNKQVVSGFGSEFVGEVVAVGKESKLKIGDRIIPRADYPTRGKFMGLPSNVASKRLQVFNQEQLIPIPPIMSDEVAASFTISGYTIFSIIRRLNLVGNESILITSGRSSTSLAALSALKNKCFDITVITTNPSIVEFQNIGIEKIIMIDTQKPEKLNKSLISKCFDIIIDPFSDIYFPMLVNKLKIGGKYITCGIAHQHSYSPAEPLKFAPIELTNFMGSLILKNIHIIGNCLGEETDILKSIDAFNKNEYLPIIDSVYEEHEYKEFFNRTFNEEKFGRVIFKYND